MTPRWRLPAFGAAWLGTLDAVLIAVATLLAGLSFSPFYGSIGWFLPLAAAVVLGTVVAALAGARRWPWWLTAPVAVLAFLIFAIYAAFRDRLDYGVPGLDAATALVDGLRSGWARMLTVALPADVEGDLLVTPLALAYAAAFAGTLVAVRTSLVSVLLVPPVLLFAAGLLFSAPASDPRLLVAGVTLLALLLLLLVRSNQVTAGAREGISQRDAQAVGLDLIGQRLRSILGRVAFGLPVVAVVTVLAVGAGWALPIADGSDRYDVRELRQQQFRVAPGLTPLVRVKPQLETAPPVRLFTVRASQRGGEYPLTRLRVAALDSFDGALWTQSRDFVITGSTLPEGPPLGRPVVTVDLDIEITRLPDPFLPVIGRPVRMAAADVAFDPANGTLVSTRSAVAGYRYRVTAEVRSPDAALIRADVSRTAADVAYTRLPDTPRWLIEEADRVTKDYRTPMTQLLAIEKFLAGRGYALQARPGHSYGAVYRALKGATEEQVGYAEQYASAFAMIARAKGYPTRVAVGYRLAPEKRQGDVYQVDTSDSHAWPEVNLAGFGWVPFEPTNPKNATSSTPPRDSTAPVLPDDPNRQQPREPETDAGDTAATVGGVGVVERVRQAAIVAGVLLLVVLVLLTLVVLAKIWRRRRRARRGTPAQRISAAWQETTDRLRERGVPAPPSLTPVELARTAAAGPATSASAQLAELALIVTTAVCGPSEPPDEAAEHAWVLEGEIRSAVDGQTSLPVRIRALIDPRPLLPRRHRRSVARSSTSTPPAPPAQQPDPLPASQPEDTVGAPGGGSS